MSINITHAQQMIHKRNVGINVRIAIKNLWEKVFPEGYRNKEMMKFISRPDHKKRLHNELLLDKYDCDCGFCG